MNYFVYNGVSSLDMGLRIESKNVFSAPEYDAAFKSIPGRDGELIVPNYRLPNIQVTYSVFVPARSIAELSAKITAIKAWLYTEPDRYHELRDTYDAEAFRKAVIRSKLDIEDQLNKIGVFTVSFSCLPYKYLDAGQASVTISEGSGSTRLVNPTAFSSKPLIRINGSGDGTLIVVGRSEITELQIAGISSHLYCDSEQMNFYKGATPMNDAVTADRFPVLTPGDNHFVFSGGITSIAVTPRWVTL